jgi:hypothetical protein
MNLKFWKKKRPVKLEVVRVGSHKLRLSEWQKDRELVGMAQRTMLNPDLQMMIQVLQNEHPGWQVLHPLSPEIARACQQSRIEGYTMALANLEALCRFNEPQQQLDATFESEQIEKE